MASSRRNSLLRLNKSTKTTDSPKFSDLDDLDDAFNAEHNINNPFSTTHTSSSVNTKWSLNESWRKLQQIIENKQEKTNQNTKKQTAIEFNSQELSNFSNDDLLNDISDCSIHEGEEIQEGDLNYIDDLDLNEEKELKDSIKNINIGLNNPNSNYNNNPSANNLQISVTAINNINNNNLVINTTLSDPSIINIPTSITTTSITTASISTTTTNKLDNKKEDNKTTHTFLFSKIKKNCSFEHLNEFEDKENEKEFFDNKQLFKLNDSLNLSSSSNLSNTTSKSKQQLNQTNKTPTKFLSSKNKQMNKFKTDFSEENSSVDGLNTTDSSDKTNLFISKEKQSSNITVTNSNVDVDEPIPSLPYFMSFIVDQFRERLNFISFTTSFFTFFILIIVIQISSLSSFANGFLIGIIFSILLLFIIIVYALNYIFQKIDYENDLHVRILKGERWKKFPAYKKLQSDDKSIQNNQHNSLHEGWFFELVYSKKLGVDRLSPAEKLESEKMPETKLQLTYIKLEGTVIRLYVPKADQSKKLKPDIDQKVNFLKVSNKMKSSIYDFSKMNTKKIHLWLPKNIINKKKYLWSRKFPFILIIEETNKLSDNKRTPFNLILFCRTNRDKEEWYNKFREAIAMADQNLHLYHLSTTVASTPDEVMHNDQDNIPRAKSLDIGNISYEFEHLSNFLSYETFIQDLLSHNLYTINGNNNSNSINQQSNNQQQNDSQQNSTNLFWFNALVGRVFFDFLTHPHWTRWVQLKIQRKLSRIKLPYFIQTIVLKNVNLGTSLPKFLSVVNMPLIDDKGIWVDFDLDYQGCFSMTLETKLDLMKLKENNKTERELKPIKSPSLNQTPGFIFDNDDLSDPESIVSLSDEDSEENLSFVDDRQARFVKLFDKLVVNNRYFQQVTDTKFLKKKMEDISNLPVQLTVNIYKLKGVLTLNLPPAPTDRIWYGFRSISEFELESKPSFGERSIQLGPIAQILSKKLKQEFHKVLVLPNLDDIVLGNVMMGNEDIEILDEVP